MFGAHQADDRQRTLTISFGWDETKQRFARPKAFVQDSGAPFEENGNPGDQEGPNGGQQGDGPQLLF